MRFRKKPVVIDAQQFHGDYVSANVIINWINQSVGFSPLAGGDPPAMYYYGDLTIRTLEGDMKASSGDWIIRGVSGEFYPCKPDIFAATYEPADRIVTMWETRALVAEKEMVRLQSQLASATPVIQEAGGFVKDMVTARLVREIGFAVDAFDKRSLHAGMKIGVDMDITHARRILTLHAKARAALTLYDESRTTKGEVKDG